jgi:hypothetical protein
MKNTITRYLWVLVSLFAFACNTQPTAQSIVDKAIEQHGGLLYEAVEVTFDFRDRHYVLIHNQGDFQYERHFKDSTGAIKDVLSNEGFTRYLNSVDITDTVKKAAAYSRSVNSVAYFALLPYRLNDPAVQKELLGTVEIKGEPYHKIKVTFNQEGGGEDFEDQFIYWIHQDNHTMDYLAYLYYTDGGGKRFRAPYNQRVVNGLRFADYENYKQVSTDVDLIKYDSLYEQNQLELLSRIELKNLKVEPL